MHNQLMRRRLLANINWIILGKVLQLILGFFVGIYSAKFLGPSNYGIINYTASYVAFFSIIANLGINDYIMKEMIDNKDKQGTVLGTAVYLQVAASIFAIISLYCLLMIVDSNDTTIQLVAFLQALNITFSSWQLITYWYQIQLKSKIPTIIATVSYTIMTIYKIVILIQGKDVSYFAFTGTLETIIMIVILMYKYKKDGGPKLKYSTHIAKRLIKNSYHFILPNIMVILYTQVDKIMLKQMIDSNAVGYYSIASNLCNIWSVVLLAIVQSSSPLIMEAKAAGTITYERRIKQMYAGIIWSSIIICLFITFFSLPIIHTIYGTMYESSAMPLSILTWSILFNFIGRARAPWIISENLQKYEKYFTVAGAILNILLNLALIPYLGIVGASIATLLTNIFVGLFMPWIFKATRKNTRLVIDAFFLKGVIDKATIINEFNRFLNQDKRKK